MEMRCAACGANQDHNLIRCEQCGKPLVFPTSFTCPRCGAMSHDLNDIVNRYCGRCHVFVDD
jgi:predicted amidophosphoribosyltransferase